MNPTVEYQRSIIELIEPTFEIDLILSPFSDQNTQGECPGGVVTSQGKNSLANSISGRGRDLYPLEDVVIKTKHDWAVVGEELSPNLDLGLNLELIRVSCKKQHQKLTLNTNEQNMKNMHAQRPQFIHRL